MIYRNVKNNPNITNRKLFKKHNVLVLPQFIEHAVTCQIRESMEKEISKGNVFRKNSLIYPLNSNTFLNGKPNRLSILRDAILHNAQLYYDYPKNYFQEVSMVREPLKNVPNLREVIRRDILPVVKTIMLCESEVIRTLAYRTENDGTMTTNANDEYHRDGDHPRMLKCIVYLTDVDENNGPFCYLNSSGKEVIVTGAAGTTIFFRSSSVMHRGSNTVKRPRYSFAFVVQPSLTEYVPIWDTVPHFQRKTVPFLPLFEKAYIRT